MWDLFAGAGIMFLGVVTGVAVATPTKQKKE